MIKKAASDNMSFLLSIALAIPDYDKQSKDLVPNPCWSCDHCQGCKKHEAFSKDRQNRTDLLLSLAEKQEKKILKNKGNQKKTKFNDAFRLGRARSTNTK